MKKNQEIQNTNNFRYEVNILNFLYELEETEKFDDIKVSVMNHLDKTLDSITKDEIKMVA
jgi:hypothetical protein